MINETKQDHVFYRIVNGMIRLLLAGAVFLLFLHSIFSTSFVGKLIREDGSEQERTLNITDSPLRHLMVFFLLTAALLAGRKLWNVFGMKKMTIRVCAVRKNRRHGAIGYSGD